ncbi:MAG: DUF5606 domain-containing protein [Bacteroidales bacterium]|jgi:hypothetical protein|nr:DUF5606 domain-containing protein [Bacteroidales bacterium]
MDLSKILFITGKSGLFSLITQTKTGAIIEDLSNGKRFPVFSQNKISVLDNISIYTADGDIPLPKVMQEIYKKENGGKCIDSTAAEADIRSYMEEILPTYDKEQVHLSDMRKLFLWYNILNDKKMIDLEQSEEQTEQSESPKEENQ